MYITHLFPVLANKEQTEDVDDLYSHDQVHANL